MAIQPKKAFCVLEFHSTKSMKTLQQEFRWKFEKYPPTTNSITKWYKIFVDTGWRKRSIFLLQFTDHKRY